MSPIFVELYNGDILMTVDGENYMVLSRVSTDVQSAIRLKIEGVYEVGLLWFRINEVWCKVKNVYIKISGGWIICKNAI